MDTEEPYSELLSSYKKSTDISSIVDFVTALNVIQFLIYGFYISAILFQYGSPPFFYGYYDSTIITNQPGTFVDRRYSLFWVFCFFQVTRLLLYAFFQLCATRSKYYRWIFEVHRVLNTIYVVFDVIYLFVLFFGYKFNCNSGIWPENPCNSVDYCKVYGNIQTTVCKPGSYDASVPVSSLAQNLTFIMERIVTIAFFVCDIIQLKLVSELRLSIVRFIYSNSK